MNKRWLINLILLALIAALALVAAWRPGLDKPRALPRLTTLDLAAIRHIEIHQGRHKPIIIAQDDNDWRMKRPRAGRIDPFAVANILRVAWAGVEDSLPSAATKSLEKYGLARPRLKLVLDNETLYFGDINPVTKGQYVHYKDRIYLINAKHFWAMARPPHHFLSRRLIESTRKAVALRLPGMALTLNNGRWLMRPANADLPTDRINQFIHEWQLAAALKVRPYSGKAILGTITLRYVDTRAPKRTRTLLIHILSRKNTLILYRPDEGLEYHFPEAVAARLLQIRAN